jgi:hypothetical protein
MFSNLKVAIPLPLVVVLKMIGRSGSPSNGRTNSDPVIVKGAVTVTKRSVEFGIVTAGPLNSNMLSRPNHQAGTVMPLNVADPTPSKWAVMLGKTIEPGGQGSKAHGDITPWVSPSDCPPLAANPSPEKLKLMADHAFLENAAPPTSTYPPVITISSARAAPGESNKTRNPIATSVDARTDFRERSMWDLRLSEYASNWKSNKKQS